MKAKKSIAVRITYIAAMAALIFVSGMFAIPLLDSKIQLGNIMAILGGFLLGGLPGGIASAIADILHDIVSGDTPIELVLSATVKFSMAFAAGTASTGLSKKISKQTHSDVLSAAIGAVTYFVLHSAKHMILKMFVEGLPLNAALLVLAQKTPATFINAIAMVIAIPILLSLLRPALKKGTGVL